MVDQKLAYLELIFWSMAVPMATIAIIISNVPLLFVSTGLMFVSSIFFLVVQYKIFIRS